MVKGARSIAQFIILQWIDKHFIGVQTELIGCDKVRMTDCKGVSTLLTVNAYKEITDAETNET